MKVLFQDDNRFMIDVEDGVPQVLIVTVTPDDQIETVFDRTSSRASQLRYGDWGEPDPNTARSLITQLKGKIFPASPPTW